MKTEREIIQIQTDLWTVTRKGTLDEVHMTNGGISFRVQVADERRKPFISRWFSDPVPASDFLKQLKGQCDEL